MANASQGAWVTYVQVRFTIKRSLIFLTPFRAAYNHRRLTIELIRQAHNRLLEKANENVSNLRNINFTNDDIMKYFIEALQ